MKKLDIENSYFPLASSSKSVRNLNFKASPVKESAGLEMIRLPK